MKITTLALEIAIMRHLDIRKNLVVPNAHWGLVLGGKPLHECDILSLSTYGYATEIELKISRQDLLNDLKKGHRHDHPYIKTLYYAVPDELAGIALDTIPKTAGLYSIVQSRYGEDKVKTIRVAKSRVGAYKWSEENRAKLARLGSMRILGLKTKIYKLMETV